MTSAGQGGRECAKLRARVPSVPCVPSVPQYRRALTSACPGVGVPWCWRAFFRRAFFSACPHVGVPQCWRAFFRRALVLACPGVGVPFSACLFFGVPSCWCPLVLACLFSVCLFQHPSLRHFDSLVPQNHYFGFTHQRVKLMRQQSIKQTQHERMKYQVNASFHLKFTHVMPFY